MFDSNSSDLLVVDVDGTLCPVDTLRILRLRWMLQHPRGVRQLREWRDVSKQFEKLQLWNQVGFSCSPPTNRMVIEKIVEWQMAGLPIIVVSGSAEGLAKWAARELTNVPAFGSTVEVNLTKRNKAEFLEENFYKYGITYIGDSPDDLHVWAISDTAILVKNRKLKGIEIKTLKNSVIEISNVSILSRMLIWLKLFTCSNAFQG